MQNKIKIDERVSPIEAFPDDNKLRVVWAYGALYKNIGKTRVPHVDILLKEITRNPNALTNNHTYIKISVAQLVKFQIMFPLVSHLCFHFFKQVSRV